MKKLMMSLAVASALSFSSNALAESPNWNYLQLGYGALAIDDLDEVTPSGASLTGSFLVSENMFVYGDFSSYSDDLFGRDVDVEQRALGLGYRFDMSENTDLFAGVSYEYAEIGVSSSSEDESGYGLTVGVRSHVTDSVELAAFVNHVDLDGSETFVGFDAQYYINEKFAVGANYTFNDVFDTYGISLRLAF